MSAAIVLKNLTKVLTKKNHSPRHIQVTNVNGRFWCSIFDDLAEGVITDAVYSGHSNVKETAVLKAHVERLERMAFLEGSKTRHFTCLTDRSDGFAAYPVSENCVLEARKNALAEATERLAWSTWWDNPEIGHEILSVDQLLLTAPYRQSLAMVTELIGASQLYVVLPKLALTDFVVVILIAQLKTGGFVSGGACDLKREHGESVLRASDELLRHGLALKRFQSQHHPPQSFYESRLLYFGLGHGNSLIERRLNSNGKDAVHLPNLAIDSPVPYSLEDVVYVHRCLYENQPPFVGGRLERFCL